MAQRCISAIGRGETRAIAWGFTNGLCSEAAQWHENRNDEQRGAAARAGNVVDGLDITSRVLRASKPMIEALNPIEDQEAVVLPSVPGPVMKDLVKIFKLLSDETRLRILFDLSRCEELHVRALCELLAQSQPAVSHHLALLRMAGLIECRREGKHNFYRVLPERVQSILESVFAGIPESERIIRFGNYSLTCDGVASDS